MPGVALAGNYLAGISVGDLAAVLEIPLPNASQHLAVLRASGLVDGRRTVLFGATSPAQIAENVEALAIDRETVLSLVTGDPPVDQEPGD